jgi:glycosyltransferase involved in cell wall biosynthesis
MRSIAIPQNIRQHNLSSEVLQHNLYNIHSGIKKIYAPKPEVSIVIPAYNEAGSILKTLSSLAASTTKKSVEIIVVNNNSTDNTAALAIAAGATCIHETTQGITAARNAGLRQATGKFILNADSDTIYPPGWIDAMTLPLVDERVVMTYGNFSFIPGSPASRLVYTGYEYVSDISRWVNKNFRDEAVNVYGFNSAFRRLEGIAVDGFNHPAGTNEDGWLAIKLRDHFHKQLHLVKDHQAAVWTSDRRIELDGGLYRAVIKRVARQFLHRHGEGSARKPR